MEAGTDVNAKAASLDESITDSDEDLKPFDGKTPLEFALLPGNTETARYLKSLKSTD